MRSLSPETEILMQFLSLRLEDSLEVLQKFAGLPGAAACFDGGKDNYVYVPGNRRDRVLLVAHADTVWDRLYWDFSDEEAEKLDVQNKEHCPVLKDGIVRQGGWDGWGLGADDRAGCAMLWLLKDSGHSLLITDGEERGQIGARHLMDQNPELAEELNAHQYMIQLDRRNGRDYKTYDLPVSGAFREFIETKTGYADAGRWSYTDIVALCTGVCGVNLSVGYYDEHQEKEYLDVEEWLNTYRIVKDLLKEEQPRFPLEPV